MALEDIGKALKETPKPVLIIGGAIIVVGGFLIIRQAQQGVQPPVSSEMTPSPSAPSPFPTIPQGQIPILPSGTNPIYDPSGNLVGYQQTPTPPSTPTPPAPTPTLPPHTVLEPSGTLAYEGALGRGAFLPGYKQFSTEGKLYNLNLPAGAKIIPGAEGRVWMSYRDRTYLLTAGSGNRVTNSTIWQGPPLLTPVGGGPGRGGGMSFVPGKPVGTWVSPVGEMYYHNSMPSRFDEIAQALGVSVSSLESRNPQVTDLVPAGATVRVR